MFEGRHDFRTFMSINNDVHVSYNSSQIANSRQKPIHIALNNLNNLLQKKPSFAIRKINHVKIERGQALTVQPFEHRNNIIYWNIIVNAQSFLYRQIRRVVGTLVAAAKGKITQRDLYEMLTIPSQTSFSNKINVAPAYGLYLADIEFREMCLTHETQQSPRAQFTLKKRHSFV